MGKELKTTRLRTTGYSQQQLAMIRSTERDSDKKLQTQGSYIKPGVPEFEIQRKIELENDKKYPKDERFERKLVWLDEQLEDITDSVQADILILKTLRYLGAEEDSQSRKQLFYYLRPQEVAL